jgi:hypothetical protein
MPRPSQFGLLGRLLLVIAIAVTMSGCNLLKPKKKSGAASGGPSYIDRTSILIDRSDDGSTAFVRWKTKKVVLCELSFYSQEDGGEPTKAAPTVQACANAEPKNDFVESLKGVRADTLYYVVISVWPKGSTKEKGESLTVRETPNNNVVGGGDGKFQDLLVARFNIPLRLAEFHRHAFGAATEIKTIKTKLVRKLGCAQGKTPKDGPFREADKDIQISGLATRDFAAGNAVKHPDFAERLQTAYASLNDGAEKWTLTYERGGGDVSVPVKPISRILNLEMESSEIVAFDEGQLAEAADPLAVDTSKPLKFAWTTGTLLESSYLTVQIGRPDYDNAIYCVFDAAKKRGEVPAAMLEKLDDGRHVVLAELSTNQLWVKDGWLINNFDWRSGRIEK